MTHKTRISQSRMPDGLLEMRSEWMPCSFGKQSLWTCSSRLVLTSSSVTWTQWWNYHIAVTWQMLAGDNFISSLWRSKRWDLSLGVFVDADFGVFQSCRFVCSSSWLCTTILESDWHQIQTSATHWQRLSTCFIDFVHLRVRLLQCYSYR